LVVVLGIVYVYFDKLYSISFFFLMRRTCTLCRVNGFDIFTLFNSALVTTQSTLGILVNALVGRGAARFDHVENATLIGCESGNFTSNGST
jgi:hypothetical protein